VPGLQTGPGCGGKTLRIHGDLMDWYWLEFDDDGFLSGMFVQGESAPDVPSDAVVIGPLSSEQMSHVPEEQRGVVLDRLDTHAFRPLR
jgi:hypothetical protein